MRRQCTFDFNLLIVLRLSVLLETSPYSFHGYRCGLVFGVIAVFLYSYSYRFYSTVFIIQHIDTLPKYGKMVLDICHLHMTDILRYLSSDENLSFFTRCLTVSKI
jgi:hypothetical protein